MIEPKLDGKVVLITGANHGIGAATARAFAAQGARVFLSYLREQTSYSREELDRAQADGVPGDVLYRAGQQMTTDAVIDEIRANGGTAAAYEADLAHVSSIPRLFDRCEAELGPVDILINNHAHCVCETFDPALISQQPGGVRGICAEQIDAHFAVNARAYALMMSEYLKRYLSRDAAWGRIINISTDAAHCHVANVSYAASKHAIESYSRSAAVELGKYGITVNIIAPGPTQTGYITPQAEAKLNADIPLGRLGVPQDIADAIVLFASDQAGWITGQLLYVGGGSQIHQ